MCSESEKGGVYFHSSNIDHYTFKIIFLQLSQLIRFFFGMRQQDE